MRYRTIIAAIAITIAAGCAGADTRTVELNDDGIPTSLETVIKPVETRGQELTGEEGQQAPVVTGHNFAGDPVSTASADQYTLLMFVTHWCPHCQTEIAGISNISSDAIPEHTRIVAVSTAVDPTRSNFPPDTWLADWPHDILVDGPETGNNNDTSNAAAAIYGIEQFPTHILIDPAGNVLAGWVGGTLQPLEIVELLNSLPSE